ncbi:MAG TPA: flagellar biosynthesis protein FlhF [Steroidobacteraceae bacterium]|nr:flagellar biosynthesis protein FlhF [Steroidobacteraceae bacterium]HNS26809.1 flagellar biosynthesis protein FlhF [Steroidobacteraceae bacterium]
MNMRRYVARDMRECLRQIREAQGPDAVILSTRKVEGGVEVVAAIDFDLAPADLAAAPAQALDTASLVTSTDEAEREATAALAALAGRSDPAAGPSTAEMQAELRSLRHLLESQLATLAWNDLTRRAPVQAEVLKELTQIGIANDIAASIIADLPPRLDLQRAQNRARAILTHRVQVVENGWLERGGRVAFVGPTGVGKSTAIAKLAAHWVLERGAQGIALVSTDGVRFGAQEQIQNLGRLLGVPAHVVDHPRELEQLLAGLADTPLVLIDTAGTSQRDQRLAAKLTGIAGAHPRLEMALVLSASSQAGAAEEVLARFAAAPLAACIVTKLDEATSLGGALSALIRARLPIAYVSDGQRIPEDLSPARAHQLIVRAVTLAERSGATADEDLLQRRFGGIAHVLA